MIRNPHQRVVDLAGPFPLMTEDGRIEIPLLDAFCAGISAGVSERRRAKGAHEI